MQNMGKNHPQHGLFAQANQFLPSLQPTPHFQDLHDKRELFGCLLQCHTGHGYAGEFYAKLKPGTNSYVDPPRLTLISCKNTTSTRTTVTY